MDAREEMVLLYHFENTEKGKRVQSVFADMGVRVKLVTKEMLGQKVGYLAEMPEAEEAGEEKGDYTFREEVLVMKDFSKERIDEMLQKLKKAGVGQINLKAVVTQGNQNWSFYELCRELEKEHKAVNQYWKNL